MSARPPLYARVLRLRYVRPGGLLCFLFFEGSVALGILLALAELAPWWSALVLPAAVAAMVKVNDTVAGGNARAHPIPAHMRTGTGRHVVAAKPGAAATSRAAGIAGAQVPRARPADPLLAAGGRVRVRGRASAPGALSPAELPGSGSGSGFLGALPPATAAIYRHASGALHAMRWPSETRRAGETGRASETRWMSETRWSAETRWTSEKRWTREYGPADERRHGPNQGRFDQPD
jgi:hypothetical protein